MYTDTLTFTGSIRGGNNVEGRGKEAETSLKIPYNTVFTKTDGCFI